MTNYYRLRRIAGSHGPTVRGMARVGFSLIELLASIAVVAILATILIAVLGHVRENAMKTNDLSNVRQVGAANLLYATEHDGYLPEVSNTGGGQFMAWPVLVKGGYATPGIFTSQASVYRERVESNPSQYNYAALNEAGDLLPANRISGNMYVITVGSWEFSSAGDLTTGWHTRARKQSIYGPTPGSPADQRMAWSYEPDIPHKKGYGHIVYMDGHAEITPTSNYQDWLDYMYKRNEYSR